MAKLDALLDEVVERGGSHLHVGGGAPPLARVRGDLVALRDGPLERRAAEELLVEILSPADRARLEQEHEVEVGYTHRDGARFRGSYVHSAGGLGATFRVLPSRAPSLAELGCPAILTRLAERSAGLVLVAGPARSGSSSVLSAVVDHVNKTRSCHVVTIEDPIELVHEPLRAQISQREIGAHTSSLEAALRNAEQEDADVIIAAGLGTAGAIAEAVRLAVSGVLVVASVRAPGAVAALEQLSLAFAPDEEPRARARLAEALAGVVAQLLVRDVDGGRTPVHEVLVCSPATAAAVRSGDAAELASLMRSEAGEGIVLLDAALERLVEAGRVAPEVALDLARDKEAFARVVARARPDLTDAPAPA